MKKKLLIIGTITLLVSVGLSGCNEVNNTINLEKDKFVGTWKYTDSLNGTWVYDFFSNGTFTILTFNGTYEIKDEKLILTYSEGPIHTFDYYFSNSDKTLTLIPSGTTGHNVIMTKQ